LVIIAHQTKYWVFCVDIYLYSTSRLDAGSQCCTVRIISVNVNLYNNAVLLSDAKFK